MAQTHVERELKFDAPADARLPSPLDVVPGAESRTETVVLRAVYYDTADRHLQRHGATLRRRTGGHDSGWHLKLPGDADARTEVHVENGAARVPGELAALVKGIRLGQPLRAAARLDTKRVRHEILDEAGEIVAEIAEDDVRAMPLIDGREPSSWCEVEVELGSAGDEATLKRARKALAKVGFEPSGRESKYGRAVGDPPRPKRPPRLAGMVDDYLQEQFRAIADEDAMMRLGENRVHRLRVAIRRTRSTIRVFGDLFDADASASFDAQLLWIAEILGRARDLDIVGERLTERVKSLPVELALGPIAADLASTMAKARAEAAAAVDEAMSGRRYHSLLRTIDRWRASAPRADADPKTSAVAGYVDTAGTKARKRLAAAIGSGENEDYHRARKAMKRYRYAAELAQPQIGTAAEATVSWAETLQDELGELQDTVTSSAVLVDLGRRVGTGRRRNGFAYGLMYGQEQQAAADIRRRLAQKYG